MGNVVNLEPVEVGDGYRFDAEKLLESAKQENFDRLVIIGETEAGTLFVSGTANAGESLILIKMAERRIVFGE